MIVVEKIRELTLVTEGSTSANDAGILSHLSAASGMVLVGSNLYVVADDELHLGIFFISDDKEADKQPGRCLTVFAGELPSKKKARKKHKPDLETLTLLPPMPGFPAGALLALGSGSKANRQRAIIIALDSNGSITGLPITFELNALYDELRTHFADLNIEGAFIAGKQLVLMQRGNQSQPKCALIYCALDDVMQLRHNLDVDFASRLIIVEYTLPRIDDVPLCFTDGVMLADGKILFTAVAENTSDSYNDGACVASALGIIDADGNLFSCELLQHAHKVEGVAVMMKNNQLQVLLVTDADNPDIPATLLMVSNAGNLFRV